MLGRWRYTELAEVTALKNHGSSDAADTNVEQPLPALQCLRHTGIRAFLFL